MIGSDLGLAGPWYGEFLRDKDDNFPKTDFERLERQLKFSVRHGLSWKKSLEFVRGSGGDVNGSETFEGCGRGL